MANFLEKFDTYDKEAAEAGVWKSLGDDIEIKVAAFGNSKFRKKFTAIKKPHDYEIKHNLINDEAMEALMTKAMAGTILLDWKGFTTEDSKEIPFSNEQAAEWLKFPKFYEAVYTLSVDEATFGKQQLEQFKEELKNA